MNLKIINIIQILILIKNINLEYTSPEYKHRGIMIQKGGTSKKQIIKDIDDKIILEKKILQNKNKIWLYSRYQCKNIILIPENIISNIIYNNNQFFDNDTSEINKEIIIELFKYMINNGMYMNEFTNKCQKFKEIPKTGCPIRMNYRGKHYKSIFNKYLYYQSVESKCKLGYIYIDFNESLLDLLSKFQKEILLNKNYKKIKEQLKYPTIYIPSLSNIFIMEESTPCLKMYTVEQCYDHPSMDIILAIINHYRYGIFSILCSKVYNEIINKMPYQIEYRVINRINYLNNYDVKFTNITTLDKYINDKYKLEYKIQLGENKYEYITNEYFYNIN